jgi:hypothetical protein
VKAAGFITIGGLMHPMNHLGFVVALTHLHVKPQFMTPFGAQFAQGLKILLAVYVRLAHSETAEVRSVDNHYFGHIASFCVRSCDCVLPLDASERLLDGVRRRILEVDGMAERAEYDETQFVAAGLLVSVHERQHIIPAAIVP